MNQLNKNKPVFDLDQKISISSFYAPSGWIDVLWIILQEEKDG